MHGWVKLQVGKNLRSVVLNGVLCCIFGVACSDPSDTNRVASGGSGNAGAGANTSVAGEDAGGGAGAPLGSSGGSNSAEKTGQVLVYAAVFGTDRSFSAAFWPQHRPTQCGSMTYGNCVLTKLCTDNADGITYASAGTITLTSTSPRVNVSIVPDTSSVYKNSLLPASLAGGETLHVAASGDTVPAFASDLTFPLLLIVDRPVADSTGLIMAPSTDDLVLSYSRGSNDVRLLVIGNSATDAVSCYADSVTSMTVPSQVLAALGAGTELRTYTVGINHVADAGWDISLATQAEAITPDKKAKITIQIR